MIWGGGSGKSGKKKLNGYSPRKKKTQLNDPEEKKNSTQQPGRKKKLIMDFMLGCDALNMDKNAFYILFRYK